MAGLVMVAEPLPSTIPYCWVMDHPIGLQELFLAYKPIGERPMPILSQATEGKSRKESYNKDPFGLRNRPMKWNSYSYKIVNPLFGRGIFLGKVTPKEMTNLINIGIAILLKNEWNSYSV
jgi:hypothetical protein